MKLCKLILLFFGCFTVLLGFNAIAFSEDKLFSLESRIKNILENKQIISDKDNSFYQVEMHLDSKKSHILNTQEIKEISILDVNQQKNSFKGVVYFANAENIHIQGNFVEYVNLPVLKSKTSRGHMLKEDDITYIGFELNKLPHDVAKHEYEIIGRVLKNSLPSKTPIKLSILSSPSVIHKKDLVNVIYHKGTITLSMSAVALDDGAIGDSIRVKNTRSNQILMAKVESNKTVSVE